MLLMERVQSLAAPGEDIAALAASDDLTTSQVAKLLKVSRPFVAKLMDEGLPSFHLVGTHRRCTAADMADYLDRRERASAGYARATQAPAAVRRAVKERRPLSEEAQSELEEFVFI